MKWKNSKKVKENYIQYTSIITIDPSTTCTGMCIDGKLFAFANDNIAETKTGKLKKWFENSSYHASIILINDKKTSKDYSEEELNKLKFYQKFTDIIIDNILKEIKCKPSDALVVLEGYSYSSSAGHLIDLVGFSTLLRSKLIDKGFNNIKIISPLSLKLETAKMIYNPETVYLNKKKTRFRSVWKNNNGITGGKFKKDDMMQALLDSEIKSDWKSFLQENMDELFSIKVPKPIEDLNDAYLLYYIHKNS